MMRTVLFSFTLAACAAKPSRNLVCERVAILSPKATCVAELSDAGPSHVHTARVTVDAPVEPGKVPSPPIVVVCGVSAGQLAMACDGLQATPKSEGPKP